MEPLENRIEPGDYPPGTLLPSENQLIKEFSISRPTVVVALRGLREHGWIESQQRRGRLIRSRPAMASVEQKRPGAGGLDQAEGRLHGRGGQGGFGAVRDVSGRPLTVVESCSRQTGMS
ncbi:GntR family transcriptional regulator [Nonomuraea sp. NPDC049684]|uniref:GntR family transcriptional regulator n=1 Tax=Nonomuraea sp. NPDC049684 TaxID=3364356 RepID=UPI0037B75499